MCVKKNYKISYLVFFFLKNNISDGEKDLFFTFFTHKISIKSLYRLTHLSTSYQNKLFLYNFLNLLLNVKIHAKQIKINDFCEFSGRDFPRKFTKKTFWGRKFNSSSQNPQLPLLVKRNCFFTKKESWQFFTIIFLPLFRLNPNSQFFYYWSVKGNPNLNFVYI